MSATAAKTESTATAAANSWHSMSAESVCHELGVDREAGLDPG